MKTSSFALLGFLMLVGTIAVACGGSQPGTNTPTGGDGGAEPAPTHQPHEGPSHEH